MNQREKRMGAFDCDLSGCDVWICSRQDWFGQVPMKLRTDFFYLVPNTIEIYINGFGTLLFEIIVHNIRFCVIVSDDDCGTLFV